MASRPRTVWRCQQCGASALKWLGRCPDCGEYGSYVEELDRVESSRRPHSPGVVTVPLSEAGSADTARVSSGIPELDRVLGGGFVAGSLVLVGGEPGVGKSTLLLQASVALAESGKRILYVCGEESPAQIGIRARRLGLRTDRVLLLAEVDIAVVEDVVRNDAPDLLVIDSIQTASDPDAAGSPGSVGQVRATTARLMRIAKDLGITTLIVGHVTKDGAIAGPRVLEHMVDTVLYFEGDRDHAFRIVRAVKNRFGSASEIGVFEMSEQGLIGVENPSTLLLGERGTPASGSAVMVAMEGSRPLLVEVQALVSPSYLQMPRRLATGVDTVRLLQVIAVLERRVGVSFSSHDVYVSVAGGVRVSEPAIDLPLALALLSAHADRPLPQDMAAFGEIGLTGAVRPVAHSGQRMVEAVRQGLCGLVARVPEGAPIPDGAVVNRVEDVGGLVAILGA